VGEGDPRVRREGGLNERVERTPRLATVMSETDCGLLAFGRNTLLDLIKASPDFAVSLLGAVSERARFVASR